MVIHKGCKEIDEDVHLDRGQSDAQKDKRIEHLYPPMSCTGEDRFQQRKRKELCTVSLARSVSMYTSERLGGHCRNEFQIIKKSSSVRTQIMEYQFMCGLQIM